MAWSPACCCKKSATHIHAFVTIIIVHECLLPLCLQCSLGRCGPGWPFIELPTLFHFLDTFQTLNPREYTVAVGLTGMTRLELSFSVFPCRYMPLTCLFTVVHELRSPAQRHGLFATVSDNMFTNIEIVASVFHNWNSWGMMHRCGLWKLIAFQHRIWMRFWKWFGRCQTKPTFVSRLFRCKGKQGFTH